MLLVNLHFVFVSIRIFSVGLMVSLRPTILCCSFFVDLIDFLGGFMFIHLLTMIQ